MEPIKMKLTSIATIISELFLMQRIALAKQQERSQQEQANTDVYSGVTDIWHTLNGNNIIQGGNPNAHPALVDYSAGKSCCTGGVGCL
jgi:hypothetical protein